MYRYIVFIVSFELCLHCWGAPTDSRFLVISDELTKLANNCANPVLAEHIKKQSHDCEVSAPPYNTKQFQCLLYYDINSQLCAAAASSKLIVKEDSLLQIETEQETSKLCKAATNWNFTDLPVQYITTAETVFKDPLKCFKACVVITDDVLKEDSNFYCKYFNWGSNMLKTVITDSIAASSTQPGLVSSNSNVADTAIKIEEAKPIDTIPGQAVVSEIQPNEVVKSEKDVEITKVADKTTSTINTVVETPKEQNVVAENINLTKKPEAELEKNNNISQIEIPKKEAQKAITSSEPAIKKEGSTINNADAVKSDQQSADPNGEGLLNQIKIPKLKKDQENEDYQDSEVDEGRDGFADGQGDDDTLDQPLPDLETKPDVNKKVIQRIEPITNDFSNDVAPKDFYTNPISDGFSEDDDHFFPFFLTAIIMVVVLYVLYHNKSKVSKVFLGLIVEGRQPGRRRNSRGHAYRRLDTLEQAMSTNTSAPPSKIIY